MSTRENIRLIARTPSLCTQVIDYVMLCMLVHGVDKALYLCSKSRTLIAFFPQHSYELAECLPIVSFGIW